MSPSRRLAVSPSRRLAVSPCRRAAGPPGRRALADEAEAAEETRRAYYGSPAVVEPAGRAAARFGPTSGRVLVRSDGYIGAVAAGGDDRSVTAYRELTTAAAAG